MNPRLKELYQSVILKHSKEPVNYEKREEAGQHLDAYNSLCGDRFHLYFDLKDGKIKDLSFHGYGCAISKASTSVLVEFLEGKSLEEAREMAREYLASLTEEGKTDELPEEFEAFGAARDFPGRMKCATLAWEEMVEFVGKD
ncbi:MAG: SUF system NifU family Fe-S cluster assembly protein [Bacteroidia bacterium]|nr:SUF system NifU family Fe-S cluster assembly protein [Bacteroidia bacterium]